MYYYCCDKKIDGDICDVPEEDCHKITEIYNICIYDDYYDMSKFENVFHLSFDSSSIPDDLNDNEIIDHIRLHMNKKYFILQKLRNISAACYRNGCADWVSFNIAFFTFA